jgi:myo-inositol 2-dehydrogenase / D-chiro-inositol 1-dehydrogenase
MKRREFLSASAGAAAGMMLLNSKSAFGYEANSAVRMALLGCGNRGSSVADSFSHNTQAVIVALGDLFPDNLEAGRAHYDKLNA